MSGGEFNYFYSKLEDFSEQIYCKYTQEEKTLSDLCRDLSFVAKTLEWWKSGDTTKEEFIKDFNVFKEKWIKERKE